MGASTRMIGGVVLAHGDDKGLRLPPAIAPVQVVVVPIYKSDEERSAVLEVSLKVRDALAGNGIRVKLDDRDRYRPGFKFSEWELKGVPVRVEIGPKEVQADQVVTVERATGAKQQMPTGDVIAGMATTLERLQNELFQEARSFRDANTHEAKGLEELVEGLAEPSGFWVAAWCADPGCEQAISEKTAATIRVLSTPNDISDRPCVACGQAGTEVATWAKAY